MRISHAAMVLVALSFVGCSDDYAAVERGKLVVSPESLTFSLPSPGEGVAEASLTLTNEGAAAVIIRDVVIDENDESVEVSLVDAQDWTSGQRSIIQGESAQMRLRWTVLDAQSDEGVITLDTSAGVVTVPFATVDIDPVLEVSAEPVGQPSDDGMVVEVRDAQAGQVRPVSLTLRGASFAPLTVSQVCLLDNSGQCSGDNVTALGDFVLCAGSVTTPQECEAPVAGQTLLFDDTSKLTMLYKPAPGAVDTTSARVQVSSDSAQTPEFVVTVRGTPCDPTVPGRECVDGSGVPQATIEAPVAQGVYYEGTGVVFEGRVLDTEDGPGDLRVRWESDVDGVLDVDTAPTSDGRVQGTTQLSEGEHFITLIVEDTDGNSGADTVLINVGPPNSCLRICLL